MSTSRTVAFVNGDGFSSESSEATGPSSPKTCSRGTITRIIVAVIIVGVISAVVADSLTGRVLLHELDAFLLWLRGNVAAGSVLFALIYAVAVVAFVPGSVLTLAAGFVFAAALGQGIGIAVATCVVFIGASVGSLAAFFLGRWVLRGAAESLVRRYRVLAAVDAAVARSGLRLMLLLRLSPVVPFSAFNYAAAATAVRARDFALAMPAILPGTAAYCYFGSLLSSVREGLDGGGGVDDTVLQWVLLSVGGVATIIALCLVTHYARQEVRTALASESDDSDGAESTAGDGDDRSSNDGKPAAAASSAAAQPRAKQRHLPSETAGSAEEQARLTV